MMHAAVNKKGYLYDLAGCGDDLIERFVLLDRNGI